mmetsp:Transcript_89215/g.186451  ORF Transcript_89215/g.186451 Transcript_89215/m.186451 type:complete len:508 (-) Transcript_89215:237-1760(-)
MSLNCFATYAEGSSSEDDFEDVVGKRACKGPVLEGDTRFRSYCACGKSLKRVAKIPDHAVLLACQSSKECSRCTEEITAGELHFTCSNCEDIAVCRGCGPGVYIGHNFDFFDKARGNLDVQDIPSRVFHYRTSRQAAKRTTRSAMIFGDENDLGAQEVAEEVVRNAKVLMDEIMATEGDEEDMEWLEQDILTRLLGCSDYIKCVEQIRLLVVAATKIFSQSNTLQEIKAPVKIYGDTHGQLRDVLLLFGCFGFPGSVECPKIVFNGDMVDRGRHQLELIVLVFALKVAMPSAVFVNRGNHEDAHMNKKYGFFRAVLESLGDGPGSEIFDLLAEAFAFLPLASRIDDKILVVHGGIGDGQWNIHELQKVRRPIRHPDLSRDQNQWLWNLLWSDPIEDDEDGPSNVFGVHASPRGKLSVKFGWNITQAFCARNGLDLVVRSHQAKKHGLGFDIMHNESLIRVFSARDYEGHDNDCAVLSVSNSEEGCNAEKDGVLDIRPQVLSSVSRSG